MKQKFTRIFSTLATIAALLLSLAACGTKPASSAPSLPASTAPTVIVEQEGTTVAGVVEAASMNTIVIRTNDGDSLAFSTMDAELEVADSLLEGDWVVLTYTGTINGTDTTGAEVIHMTDKSEHIDKAVEDTSIAPLVQAEGATASKTAQTGGATAVNLSTKAAVPQAVNLSNNLPPIGPDMFATTRLHVRDNYVDGKIIATLEKGDEVVITGSTQNGWKQIDYNGTVAYVFGDYLSLTKPTVTLEEGEGKATAEEMIVYTTANLRLHESPSLDAKTIGVAKAGTTLHKVGSLGKWILVLHDGGVAYCDSEFVTTTPHENAVVHGTNGLPEGVNKVKKDVVMFTTVSLHLRAVCSSDSGLVATVPKNTALHVTGILDNHWSEVQYDGRTLFCVTEFLSETKPSAAVAPAREMQDIVQESVFATSYLHIYSEPSLGGKLLDTVDAGREFTRNALSASSDWSRIDYNGKEAYCLTQYVSVETPSTMNKGNDVAETAASGTMTVTANLRMHVSPDINTQVLCTIPQSATVTRLSTTANGWTCIEYNNMAGYCTSEYLQ